MGGNAACVMDFNSDLLRQVPFEAQITWYAAVILMAQSSNDSYFRLLAPVTINLSG